MKIFGIGMTGYIGSVVLEKLLEAGHEVHALARSGTSADLLKEAGASPVSGSLADVEVIRREAAAADCVVQVTTGGILSETKGHEDEAPNAVTCILDTLEGTGKPYILGGGVAGFLGTAPNDDGVVYIDGTLRKANPVPGFYAEWNAVFDRILDSENHGMRGMIINPVAVFGREGGYINALPRRLQSFREHGIVYAAPVKRPAEMWVNVDDLAELYVLALERGKPGGNYFAVTDSAPLLDVLRKMSVLCGQEGAVVFTSSDRIAELDDWLAKFDFDAPTFIVDPSHAFQELGWKPHHRGVLAELDHLIETGADINAIYPGPARKAQAAKTLAALRSTAPMPE